MLWLLALLPLQDSWLTTFQASEARLELGDVEGARADLERCLELEAEHATTAYHLAALHARGGLDGEALDWLKRAVEWGYADDAVMAWDPDLAALRERPRFEQLLSRALTNPAEAAEQSVAEVRWDVPRVLQLVPSPDGSRAVTDGRGEALMWNMETWDLEAILDEGTWWRDCALAPGGGSFVLAWSGEQTRVGAWDTVTGFALWQVQMPSIPWSRSITPIVRFSEDGEQVVLQDRFESFLSPWVVRLSDGELSHRGEELDEVELAPSTAQTVTVDRPPPESSFASAIVPIGESVIALATEVAYGTGNSEVRLVDVATTRLLSSRKGGVGRISRMDHIEECALLVLGGEERTGFFDLRSGAIWSVPGDHYWPSPDGRRIAVADGMIMRIFDLRTRLSTLEVALGSRIRCAAWSHAGDRLAVGRAAEVRILDTDSGAEAPARPIVHPAGVYSVSFRADDRRLATAGGDPWLRIWDTATGELLAAPSCSGMFGWSHVENATYTKDGGLLLAVLGETPEVQARDPESLDLLWTHTGFRGGPNRLTLQATRSGRLLCGGRWSSESRILDLADGTLVMGFEKDVQEVVASPREGHVYTVHDGAIDVLDGETLERRYTRVEFPDEGELVFLPSLYCRGTPEALRNTWLIREGRATSMDSLASVLYDPKRVAAGAAGIKVRPAALPAE